MYQHAEDFVDVLVRAAAAGMAPVESSVSSGGFTMQALAGGG